MKSVVLFVVALCLRESLAQVSCDDIKIIIDTHNELRKQVATGGLEGQPKAADMQKIVWDDTLAVMAQKWANGHKFQHNAHRKDKRFQVGENIYESFGTFPDSSSAWKDAVNSWYSEHNQYSYGPIGDISETGHYTQVVWADTLYVGCGYSHYKKDGQTHKLYVCDYGPAGNWDGEFPYKTGAGCEDLCCKDQCDAPYGAKC